MSIDERLCREAAIECLSQLGLKLVEPPPWAEAEPGWELFGARDPATGLRVLVCVRIDRPDAGGVRTCNVTVGLSRHRYVYEGDYDPRRERCFSLRICLEPPAHAEPMSRPLAASPATPRH